MEISPAVVRRSNRNFNISPWANPKAFDYFLSAPGVGNLIGKVFRTLKVGFYLISTYSSYFYKTFLFLRNYLLVILISSYKNLKSEIGNLKLSLSSDSRNVKAILCAWLVGYDSQLLYF